MVEEFLQYYGLNPKDVITIENKGSRELPHCMAVGDLFTKVLDILGKPNNRFYKTLGRAPQKIWNAFHLPLC